MNQIKFNELSLKKKPWRVVLLSIIAILFVLSILDGTSNHKISQDNQLLDLAINTLPLLLLMIFHSRPYFYKNYVEWNKKGINIKLGNKFLYANYRFNEIESFKINESSLIIIRTNGDRRYFDIENIEEESLSKLRLILEKYI